jgi:glutaredoxin-related protein
MEPFICKRGKPFQQHDLDITSSLVNLLTYLRLRGQTAG